MRPPPPPPPSSPPPPDPCAPPVTPPTPPPSFTQFSFKPDGGKVFCMDVRENGSGGGAMVVCTAPLAQGGGGTKSNFYVYDINNPGTPVNTVESPLKFQSRAVRIFADNQLFVVSSIEGRCAIKPLDRKFETCPNGRTCPASGHLAGCPQVQPNTVGNQKLLAFNFRCHRSLTDHAPLLVYPVNAIDCHPLVTLADGVTRGDPVFATGGSDGVVKIWQRHHRTQLGVDLKGPQIGTEEIMCNKSGQCSCGAGGQGRKTQWAFQQPVVDVKWNPAGDLLATAFSYDWHKGAEHHKAEHVPSIYVKGFQPADLRPKT